MKADTININKWEVNEAASNSYDIINHGLNNTRINVITQDYRHSYSKAKDTAELIVAAVNACKDINPDNPLNAAKVLPELFHILLRVKIMFDNRAEITGSYGNENLYASLKRVIECAVGEIK